LYLQTSIEVEVRYLHKGPPKSPLEIELPLAWAITVRSSIL
jgi:hypothetical protein